MDSDALFAADTGLFPLPNGGELPRVNRPLPGARSSALCDLLAEVECPALTTRRARRAEQSGADHDPIVWSAARGANVLDADGNVYVDLTAGFGAALVGHGHPRVVGAVQTQAARLMHALGDVYPSEPKIALEAHLAELAPWPRARVILGLSGSDAVEAAMKTAALATGRPGIVAFEGGYHGLGHGPLAACGYKPAFRTPFAGQLGAHVVFAPYPARGDTDACARAVDAVRLAVARGGVGAVLLEPVLGRGGVVPGEEQAIDAICEEARAHGAVVIADEIYTGMRRTCAQWLYTAARWPSAPDIVCLGKALGGGLPVSACLIRPEVAAAWGDPRGEAIHTSTFLGNPLACAAALATLDVLATDEATSALAETSSQLWRAVRAVADDPRAGVRDVAGAQLLLGVHLEGGVGRALAVVRALLERGYIVLPGGVRGDCLTLTPPLALTPLQIEGFAAALGDALRAVEPRARRGDEGGDRGTQGARA